MKGERDKDLFIQLRMQLQPFPGGHFFSYTCPLGKIQWVTGVHPYAVCPRVQDTWEKSGPGSNWATQLLPTGAHPTLPPLAAGWTPASRSSLDALHNVTMSLPPRDLPVLPHQGYSLLHRHPLTALLPVSPFCVGGATSLLPTALATFLLVGSPQFIFLGLPASTSCNSSKGSHWGSKTGGSLLVLMLHFSPSDPVACWAGVASRGWMGQVGSRRLSSPGATKKLEFLT